MIPYNLEGVIKNYLTVDCISCEVKKKFPVEF